MAYAIALGMITAPVVGQVVPDGNPAALLRASVTLTLLVWVMNPGVLAVVQRSPLGQILRREGMHFNLEIAVGRYLRDELVREQP